MARSRIVLAVVTVVAVVAAAAVHNAVTPGGSPSPAGLVIPPSTSGAPAPSGAGTAPVVLTPTIPGWTPVRSVRRGVVYDVPPTWRVFPEYVFPTFDDDQGNPRVAGGGGASFGDGVCGGPGTWLALATTKQATETDLLLVGAVRAYEWADAGYRDDTDRRPSLTLGTPERLTTAAGQEAVIVKATATPATPVSECKLGRGAVYTITATGYRGELGPTVSLIVVVDELLTGPRPVPESEVRQVLSTLRPAP